MANAIKNSSVKSAATKALNCVRTITKELQDKIQSPSFKYTITVTDAEHPVDKKKIAEVYKKNDRGVPNENWDAKQVEQLVECFDQLGNPGSQFWDSGLPYALGRISDDMTLDCIRESINEFEVKFSSPNDMSVTHLIHDGTKLVLTINAHSPHLYYKDGRALSPNEFMWAGILDKLATKAAPAETPEHFTINAWYGADGIEGFDEKSLGGGGAEEVPEEPEEPPMERLKKSPVFRRLNMENRKLMVKALENRTTIQKEIRRLLGHPTIKLTYDIDDFAHPINVDQLKASFQKRGKLDLFDPDMDYAKYIQEKTSLVIGLFMDMSTNMFWPDFLLRIKQVCNQDVTKQCLLKSLDEIQIRNAGAADFSDPHLVHDGKTLVIMANTHAPVGFAEGWVWPPGPQIHTHMLLEVANQAGACVPPHHFTHDRRAVDGSAYRSTTTVKVQAASADTDLIRKFAEVQLGREAAARLDQEKLRDIKKHFAICAKCKGDGCPTCNNSGRQFQ